MAKKKISKKHRGKQVRKPRGQKFVKVTIKLFPKEARALRRFAKICGDNDLSSALKKVAQFFEN